MDNDPLPAMLFPLPSGTLLRQARADAPRGKMWTWLQALPQTIQQCLSRWQIEWTGESLKQGYFGYVLPCGCQDGTHAILKLSPLAQEAQAQAIALSAWAGNGAPRLLAESCDDHGGSLLIGRIMPGWPLGTAPSSSPPTPTPELSLPEAWTRTSCLSSRVPNPLHRGDLLTIGAVKAG
jgi:hypothetical protein